LLDRPASARNAASNKYDSGLREWQQGQPTRKCRWSRVLPGLEALQQGGRIVDAPRLLRQRRHLAQYRGLGLGGQGRRDELRPDDLRHQGGVRDDLLGTLGGLLVILRQPPAFEAEDALGCPRINLDLAKDQAFPVPFEGMS